MPKTLIFGAGYLGHRFAETLPDAVLIRTDITDFKAVLEALEVYKPAAVLNAAGKTGIPNVDWCESNKHAAYLSNTVGPMVLARACATKGAHLTHLSSGCIFYGPSPVAGLGWREHDFANPISFYSKTKYAADLILSQLPNAAVARLRMPIDSVSGPRNLITKLAGYSKIVDVENSVTVVDDLIAAVSQLMEERAEGIFHVVNDGIMKHRDLIALYEELVDPSHANEWISEADLVARGLAVKARSNCILQNTRLKEYGISMRPIQIALRETMEKYAALRVPSTNNRQQTTNN